MNSYTDLYTAQLRAFLPPYIAINPRLYFGLLVLTLVALTLLVGFGIDWLMAAGVFVSVGVVFCFLLDLQLLRAHRVAHSRFIRSVAALTALSVPTRGVGLAFAEGPWRGLWHVLRWTERAAGRAADSYACRSEYARRTLDSPAFGPLVGYLLLRAPRDFAKSRLAAAGAQPHSMLILEALLYVPKQFPTVSTRFIKELAPPGTIL